MSTTTDESTHAEQVHEMAQQALGFVPNLITEMTTENPAVGEAYLSAQDILQEGGVLSAAEQQTVILAVSSYNDCHYCTKAHAVAGQQAGLGETTVQTINEGGLPEDARLRALVRATRRLLGKRGWLSEAEFADLDLGRPELYEIVALIGIKTTSNYINHIAETELDEPFRQ